MPQLFLLRHLKSQWNEENRFAGWTDGPLCKEGKEKAKELAQKVFNFKIDVIYTSPLFRNMDTVARIFEWSKIKYPMFSRLDAGKMQRWAHYTDISDNDVPVFVTEKLNERYYGKLQGESKDEAIKKHGSEKVHLWRRSLNIAPPGGGECLKDVCKRTIPFFKKYIENDLKAGKNVLIVASHNSLRAIIKELEKFSAQDIIDVEVDYGGLIKYEFDKKLNIVKKEIF